MLVVMFYQRESWSTIMFRILSFCFQVGLRIFIFFHWSKVLGRGNCFIKTNKQTNRVGRNVQIKEKKTKQTNTPEITFLKVITRQLPVQFRPSPLNPNKQVHTKDPFVFWQVAFRWQSWVFFWHSSISKKMGKKRKILQRKWFHESDNTFIFNFYKMKKH